MKPCVRLVIYILTNRLLSVICLGEKEISPKGLKITPKVLMVSFGVIDINRSLTTQQPVPVGQTIHTKTNLRNLKNRNVTKYPDPDVTFREDEISISRPFLPSLCFFIRYYLFSCDIIIIFAHETPKNDRFLLK